jgi:hypothetical protein
VEEKNDIIKILQKEAKKSSKKTKKPTLGMVITLVFCQRE